MRTVYHARAGGGEVQGVMCYVLPRPACLLSIPQPPLFDLSRCAAPAPAHWRWSHHVMSPTHETRAMGRGVNTWDFSSHKNTNSNEWLDNKLSRALVTGC